MKHKNTRRGNTQLVLKNNPVNIPELASGSSTQSVTQPSSQRQALKMPKQVRQYSYLTRAYGFTLIELLVVVLIIGILAAVALPQYQKAVAKAEAVKFISTIKALETAFAAYILENGFVDKIVFDNTGDQIVDNRGDLSVEIPLDNKMLEKYKIDIECSAIDQLCMAQFSGGNPSSQVYTGDISWGADFTQKWTDSTCTDWTDKGTVMCSYINTYLSR